MKKISLLLMLFFTSVLMLNVQAAPVDSLTAKDLARTFWGNVAKTPVRNLQNMPVKIVYKAMSDVSAAGRESSVCYYIINVGQKGFVILAGDDRITPILGYSTESRFVTEGMPENITYWLDARRKEISYALSEGCLTSTSEIAYQWENLSEMGATKSVVVSPLLQTSWNQDTYYNQFCPSDASGPGGHAYAGCVATAMAQVIRFWQWPNSGFNTHSYTCDYGTLSVDFGSVTHNYNNMPNSLSSSTSSPQCNAVATLIYHCGVSVNMNYGANGSGASSVNVPSALVNYFAYPEGMEYVYRDNYSDNDWNTLIRNELNEGHPVYYRHRGYAGIIGVLGCFEICKYHREASKALAQQ